MTRPPDPHLSNSDTFALLLERDPLLRSTIVAIATFDRSPSWKVLNDRIERATRLSPRFRMKLVRSTLGVAPPQWVVDPDFDLTWHLRRARVHKGGDRAAVLRFARNAGMEAFDHDRPLWVFTLLEGLPNGRAALVMKVHHSLTDGIGGIQIAQHVVDLQRTPAALGPMPDPPRPAETRAIDELVEPIGFQVGRVLGAGGSLVRQLPGAVARAARNPVAALGDVVDSTIAVARFVRPVTTTLSPVMTERSFRWHYAELEVPFDRMRSAAHRVDCTLNDVFLSGIAGGMRRYHTHHGAAADRLRLSMPISVRAPDDPEGGNRVTITRFEIPVGLNNAGVRTVEIGRRCESLRADPAIGLGNQIALVLNLLPISITGGMLKHVDFLASNVPGFREDIFVGGARLESFHPFGPTLGSAANITLMSYKDRCCIGINTDEGAIVDPEVFGECLRAGFDEVMSLAD
jgi:diacylglycerol O-acyltransferase / wax synthase